QFKCIPRVSSQLPTLDFQQCGRIWGANPDHAAGIDVYSAFARFCTAITTNFQELSRGNPVSSGITAVTLKNYIGISIYRSAKPPDEIAYRRRIGDKPKTGMYPAIYIEFVSGRSRPDADIPGVGIGNVITGGCPLTITNLCHT